MDEESGYQGAGDACAQRCVSLCLPVPATMVPRDRSPHMGLARSWPQWEGSGTLTVC